jgi:segregation and condensation protein A
MTAEYNVKLKIFEGPLDLLLHLIKVNELEITEVSISQITSQYLETVRLVEALDLEIAGDYLVMAASLINIKLRSILPEPESEVEEDQEQEGDDFLTARALMQRLIEYRKFKEAAQLLGRSADRQSLIFVRDVALPALSEAQADPQVQGDLDLLLEAFSRVIKFVQRRDYHQVQEEEYTIEDKILLLRRRLLVETRVSLTELFEDCHTKIEMIVTVIAILELCRLKELSITQTDSFDHLYVTPRLNASNETTQADEAEQLAQIEASIMANRTGLVDDGQLSEDDEDVLLDRLLNPDSPGTSEDAPADAPAAEDNTAPEPPVLDPPATEQDPAQQEAEDPAEEDEPSADEDMPLAEGDEPPAGEDAPAVEEDELIAEEDMPAAEEDMPAAEENEPAAEGALQIDPPAPDPITIQPVPPPSTVLETQAAPEPQESPDASDTSVDDSAPPAGAQIIEMAWARPEGAPPEPSDGNDPPEPPLGGQDEPR